MTITRVQYRERQRLAAADLRAEQDYRLGLAGRHHLTLHDWGVVRGLRVIADPQGDFTLTRGVAIDGYGREIYVAEPIELEILDLKKCWSILLYYCERPEQVPPGRICQDDPAPRIGQAVAAVVEEEFTPPALGFDDFGRARAAGRLAGLRPWPVVVARVGLGCAGKLGRGEPLVDYATTRYVRHRAGVLRTPTGRALMQLGLTSRTDVYHFLLSTRDNGHALTQRMGIDRDHMTHVWRPLVIYGAQAVGQFAVAQNQMLQIKTDSIGGGARRVQVAGVINPKTHILSASIVDLGDPRASQRPALEGSIRFDPVRPLAIELPLGQTRAASFNLIETPIEAQVPPGPAGGLKKKKKAAAAPATAFSVLLAPTGGQLVMEKRLTSSEAAPGLCGDLARFRADSGESVIPVVQFRPATELEADPTAREIHAVTTSKPTDPVPRTELRLAGGNEDESDTSSRLSIGAWVHKLGNPTWLPAFRMDGGRRLDILAAPGAPDTTPLLEVEGAVYLPPIGKKDPLLPDLMAMAFIAGLRQIGRVAPAGDVTLTMPAADLPSRIVRGDPLTYKFTATWGASVQVKRCLELITGTSGSGDMAFRTLTGVDRSKTTFTIQPEPFTHPAAKVRIEIQILVSKNNVTSVAVCTSPEIDVVDQ